MAEERPAAGLELDLAVLWQGGLLLLLLTAFAVRLPGLTVQSLWRDEVDALRFSQDALSSLLGNFSRPGWNGPLYYLVLRAWVALAGQSEFALRYLSLLSGVLGVAILYRLGNAWFGPYLGAVAALLMVASPYMIWYSQEAKMYALLPPLVIGILLLYRHVLESRDWREWLVLVIGVWILMGLHVMGVLLIPTLALMAVPWWPLVRRGGVRQVAIALGLCLLPVLVTLPWAWPLLWRGGDIGHEFVSLPGMVVTMLYAFARGITATGGLWPVGLVILFVLAGALLWPDAHRLLTGALDAFAGRRSGIAEPSYLLVMWAWLFVPLLGLLLISTRVPMFVDRYLIWIGPALFVWIARGYLQLRVRMPFLAGLCLAALLILNGWAVLEQSTTPIKSDFRAAAAYLHEHRQPDEPILFHISYVRDTFEYYFGGVRPALDGIPTSEQTTEEELDQAMRAQLAKVRPGRPEGASEDLPPVVWLVLSEPEMWDRRGMTVTWLDAHARPDLRAEFARVSVVRYRFDEP